MEVYMRKSLSRNLYLIGLVVVIVGVVLLVVSLAGSTTATNAYGTTTVTNIGNPALFGVGIILEIVGGIISFIGYIGALVRTAQLGRWGWFVCLLLLSGITMLIYIFAGPETPPYKGTTMPPPSSGYQQG